jgi:hypothetical protein
MRPVLIVPLLVVLAAPVAAQPAATHTSLWPDHAAIEAFLERADITARERIGSGVNNPYKLTLEQDGVVRHAVYKDVEKDTDHWRYEIAAYELDKLLGVGRVPPTVRRRLRGYTGCVQLWVDGVTVAKATAPPPDLEAYRREVSLMWLFDDLVANVDRHLNNALITADSRLAFIDNSKTFQDRRDLMSDLNMGATGTHLRYWFAPPGTNPPHATEYPPSVIERVRSLTDDEIRRAIGRLVPGDKVARLLERRRLVLKKLDAMNVTGREAVKR